MQKTLQRAPAELQMGDYQVSLHYRSSHEVNMNSSTELHTVNLLMLLSVRRTSPHCNKVWHIDAQSMIKYSKMQCILDKMHRHNDADRHHIGRTTAYHHYTSQYSFTWQASHYSIQLHKVHGEMIQMVTDDHRGAKRPYILKTPSLNSIRVT